MKKHIELDRRFYRIDERTAAFPEDATYYADSEHITDAWTKLLLRKRVVVLAEAGMGKSEELLTQAKKLVAAGKPAFNARIERLADGDLDKALECGDPAEVALWREGDGFAYFFLDSLDEARLTHKRFRDALKTVAQTIRGAEERAHIFISSRPSDWRWTEDLATVKEVLPVRSAESCSDLQKAAPLSDETLLGPMRPQRRSRSRYNEEDAKSDTVSVVRLLGLSPSKIEHFANERGVPNVPAFMRALADANAMTLVARPQDLDGIIRIWKKSKRIGTHCEALRGSIAQRIKETNLDQARLRELTEAEAMEGTQRVAAALTLCRVATSKGRTSRARRSRLPPPGVVLGHGVEALAAVLPEAEDAEQRRLARPEASGSRALRSALNSVERAWLSQVPLPEAERRLTATHRARLLLSQGTDRNFSCAVALIVP
jgi:hypothetical protein